MRYNRAERVGDQIQREISRMLYKEIKDPRIGMVTISRVLVTRDLSLARVYYTVYGDEAVRTASRIGLEHAAGHIRRQLGRHLRIRTVPELRFIFDRSLDHVERIERLLKEIHQSEMSAPLAETAGEESQS